MLDAQGRVVQSAETINRNLLAIQSGPVSLDAVASTKLMVLTLRDKVLPEVAHPQKIHVRRVAKNLELVLDGDFSEGADFIINNYFDVCNSNDCRIYGYDPTGKVLEYQVADGVAYSSWTADLFGQAQVHAVPLVPSAVAAGGGGIFGLWGLVGAGGLLAAVALASKGESEPAPSSPQLALAADTGLAGDALTQDARINVSGAPSDVTVYYSLDQGKTWTTKYSPVEGLNTVWVQAEKGGVRSPTSTMVFTLDTKGPEATITMDKSILKVGDTATVTITFNEKVTGFSKDDVIAQQGSLGDFVSDASGLVWKATFTPEAGSENLDLKLSLQSTYTDLAGNAGQTAAASYGVDTQLPSFT
eukprot:gene22680-27651_t